METIALTRPFDALGRTTRPGEWKRRLVLGVAAVVGTALIAGGCGSNSNSSSKVPSGTTVIALDGLNGDAADQAPTCVAADSSVSGDYGQEWCFGATFTGGTRSNGVVYRVKPNGTQYSVLWNFDVLTGLAPSIGVAVAPDRSELYGSTTQGGSTGSGLIWAFDTSSGTVSNLHSFTGPEGTTPQSSPILVNGTLYGLTGQSGANGVGAVYAQPTSGGSFSVLHQFTGGANDVANPFGALTFNPNDGLLYGMGFLGGANGMGGIFSVAPDGSGYALRASFTPATGGMPQMEALVLSPQKVFYGVGWAGGIGAGVDGAPGNGTIFRFDPATNSVTSFFEFTTETGTQPYGTLGMSADGQWLYAMCWKGGANSLGTLVAVRSDGSSNQVLVDLDSKGTGGSPFAAVEVSPDGGHLLTATGAGAANNVGALLSVEVPSAVR